MKARDLGMVQLLVAGIYPAFWSCSDPSSLQFPVAETPQELGKLLTKSMSRMGESLPPRNGEKEGKNFGN